MYAEAFFKYVADQNPDRTVNHASWSTCAVGDFWHDYTNHTEHGIDNNCPLLVELEEDHGFIHEVLNQSGIDEWELEDYAKKMFDISHLQCITYGDLHNIIQVHKGHSWDEGMDYYRPAA